MSSWYFYLFNGAVGITDSIDVSDPDDEMRQGRTVSLGITDAIPSKQLKETCTLKRFNLLHMSELWD